MTPADAERLRDMIAHAQRAIDFLKQAHEPDLVYGSQSLSAILWEVSIIGEAASQLSKSAQAAAGSLPLQDARRMRNVLIHGYPEIDAATVIDTVRNDLPELITGLERLLRDTE